MKKFNIILILIIVITSIGYYGTYQLSKKSFREEYKIDIQQEITQRIYDSIQNSDSIRIQAISTLPMPRLGLLFPRYIWRVLESWEYGNDTDDPGVYKALCDGIVFMDNKYYPVVSNKRIDYSYPRTSFDCDSTTHYKIDISTGGAFGEFSFWTEEEAKAEAINRIRKTIKKHEHAIDKIIAP